MVRPVAASLVRRRHITLQQRSAAPCSESCARCRISGSRPPRTRGSGATTEPIKASIRPFVRLAQARVRCSVRSLSNPTPALRATIQQHQPAAASFRWQSSQVCRTPGISCERPICSTLVCFIPLFGCSVRQLSSTAILDPAARGPADTWPAGVSRRAATTSPARCSRMVMRRLGRSAKRRPRSDG